MKQLKRFFILAAAMLVAGTGMYAQCSPDSTLGNVTGLYPDTLQYAIVDSMYEQVINVIASEDTTVTVPGVGTLALDFCEIRIDSITNIPPGMSFACNEPDCIYTINHADADSIMRFCASLSGRPTSVYDDSLRVYVKLSIGFYSPATNTCTPLGTLPDSLTTIVFPIRFVVTDGTPVEDFTAATVSMKLIPNPGFDKSMLTYQLPEAARVEVGIYNLFGQKLREVYNGKASPGSYQHQLELADLPAGLYFVQLKLDEGKKTFTQKLLKQ
ncbi:MAG: T9SS C-terminal target domain-containing protein [Bacteroidetes bacterium]|nr:MAG: T9SS C-terminal target domain-containing protein [Bacteroidota bacterium]